VPLVSFHSEELETLLEANTAGRDLLGELQSLRATVERFNLLDDERYDASIIDLPGLQHVFDREREHNICIGIGPTLYAAIVSACGTLAKAKGES